MNETDRRIHQLMEKQHGLISRHQALDAGLNRGQIQHRLSTGRWEYVAQAVYRLAGVPRDWDQLAHAACLHCPEGVASFSTTAALAGLAPRPQKPDVTVPYSVRWSSSIATVHRARLHPVDKTTINGVPSTTAQRMLVDCAAKASQPKLNDLVSAVMHSNQNLTAASIDAAWDRSQLAPGRKGHTKLMKALVDWRSEIRAGSPAEVRLIRALQQWGYPEPECQIVITDAFGAFVARLDVGWSDTLIGIEYDSPRWHGPDRWKADESRQKQIEALGWNVLRADKADLRPGERSLRDALAKVWRERESQEAA